jgi:hypothetical protein
MACWCPDREGQLPLADRAASATPPKKSTPTLFIAAAGISHADAAAMSSHVESSCRGLSGVVGIIGFLSRLVEDWKSQVFQQLQ